MLEREKKLYKKKEGRRKRAKKAMHKSVRKKKTGFTCLEVELPKDEAKRANRLLKI